MGKWKMAKWQNGKCKMENEKWDIWTIAGGGNRRFEALSKQMTESLFGNVPSTWQKGKWVNWKTEIWKMENG